LSAIDRARAILWFVGREDVNIGLQVGEICKIIESSGHPKQNESRLRSQLKKDKLISRVPGQKEWRLHPRGRKELDYIYGPLINTIRIDETPSILPDTLFKEINKIHIHSIIKQINVSYNIRSFDCCAVMVRRLMESLIIEVYIKYKKVSEIQSGGTFLMLESLIKKIINDKSILLSRDMSKSMMTLKKMGDTASHDRMYITTQTDIDEEKSVIRKTINELFILSGLKK
jgi:hypothetical protein